MAEHKQFAVLIDADNASPAVVPDLLAEIAKYGSPTVKRAYGDWTTQNLVGWKEQLHRHAIQPMQQFAYTKGKGATDSACIIDAMDLLYAGNVDGFCLVSSDSDFTRLATRLRESGKYVIGMGEQKTPEAFRAACDRFVFVELLGPKSAEVDLAAEDGGQAGLREILTFAVRATERDDGWAGLSAVGSHINKTHNSFDARAYGFAKLGDLVRKQPYLEVRAVPDSTGQAQHLYVRLRGNPSA